MDEGVHVIGAAREAPEAGGPHGRGGTFHFQTADLSSDVGAREFAERVTGPLDILVNSVGSAPARLDGFSSVSDARWLQSLSLNLLAAVRVTRAFVPSPNAGAAIVMIASENSTLPDPPVMLVARWRM